jgi:large subunit ribosomal protein L13
MKTTFTNKETSNPKWYIIDADGKALGRLAVAAANIIRGKHKPNFTTHSDAGDFVVVVNAGKVKLTGKKEVQKEYKTFTKFVGTHREETAQKVRARRPQLLVERAVKGMVPHTRLGRAQLRKLKVYPGSEHPHISQQPESLNIAA